MRHEILKEAESIPGWLTPECMEHLAAEATLAQQRFAPFIVEIGAWKGKSAYILAKSAPSIWVVSIDHFQGSAEHGSEAEGLIAEHWKTHQKIARNHIILVTDSDTASLFFRDGEDIALLFIDGSHDKPSVTKDFCFYQSKVVENGTIILHDAGLEAPWEGPAALRDEIIAGKYDTKTHTYEHLVTGRDFATFTKRKKG